MEGVEGDGEVDRGGPSVLSPLTGCYLLIVIGEPHCQNHKDVILKRIEKGLLSWDSNDCHVDLEKELSTITEQSPEGEEAKYGERLIQYASENLVTEVLIYPAVSTLIQCMKNLLSSFTRHRHIIHSGYSFGGNGSWILQDGTFSYVDFAEAFQELEVQRVLKAYENSISLDLHCSPEGEWTKLSKESFTKMCKFRVNPDDVLTSGNSSITNFLNYLKPFLNPTDLESVLESSDIVGNIRFSYPTLYIFPAGQGDAALFGINGFNMLVDGGFSRKACFWNFVRHLDRLDAVLLTRVNNNNIGGIGSLLRRKRQSSVYPQIGHFFCNIQERKSILSPDGDKDKDPLLVNLFDEGQELVENLHHINLHPQICYRDVEPINLYHKVGHGTLDMFVLSPTRESKEVREFLQKWNTNDQKLFSNQKQSRDFNFPIQNLVSICAMLVWQPANVNDNITRILFPGSAPQHKVFEGLDKLKQLEFFKYPTCSIKSLTPIRKTKQIKGSMIEKILQEQKLEKQEKQKEKIGKMENKNEEIKVSERNGVGTEKKTIKKVDSTESEKSLTKSIEIKKNEEMNGKMPEEKQQITKPKSKVEAKPKIDTKPKVELKLSKQPPKKTKAALSERKPSPKKTIEAKENGEVKEITTRRPITKQPSPPTAPAKSAKDANNRKVAESKKTPPKDIQKPEKKEVPERKPISRRPKGVLQTAKLPASPQKKLEKKLKLDKEGTTDSSTVSTPSADQDIKKDISKLTAEELEQLKARELADLQEEQEVNKEIEAVFLKSDGGHSDDNEMRRIKNISMEDGTDEEYLIIEKEEIEHVVPAEKIQKDILDTEETEKRETSQQEKKIVEETQEKAKTEEVEEKKESVDKKLEEEKEIADLKSQPEDKFSTPIESGATTAPTLPEDERMPLEEIKEAVIEEKHTKEETKESDKKSEAPVKLPVVTTIKLERQTHMRDVVKTPDEVADLPVHEEADIETFEEFEDDAGSKKDQRQMSLEAEMKKAAELPKATKDEKVVILDEKQKDDDEVKDVQKVKTEEVLKKEETVEPKDKIEKHESPKKDDKQKEDITELKEELHKVDKEIGELKTEVKKKEEIIELEKESPEKESSEKDKESKEEVKGSPKEEHKEQLPHEEEKHELAKIEDKASPVSDKQEKKDEVLQISQSLESKISKQEIKEKEDKEEHTEKGEDVSDIPKEQTQHITSIEVHHEDVVQKGAIDKKEESKDVHDVEHKNESKLGEKDSKKSKETDAKERKSPEKELEKMDDFSKNMSERKSSISEFKSTEIHKIDVSFPEKQSERKLSDDVKQELNDEKMDTKPEKQEEVKDLTNQDHFLQLDAKEVKIEKDTSPDQLDAKEPDNKQQKQSEKIELTEGKELKEAVKQLTEEDHKEMKTIEATNQETLLIDQDQEKLKDEESISIDKDSLISVGEYEEHEKKRTDSYSDLHKELKEESPKKEHLKSEDHLEMKKEENSPVEQKEQKMTETQNEIQADNLKIVRKDSVNTDEDHQEHIEKNALELQERKDSLKPEEDSVNLKEAHIHKETEVKLKERKDSLKPEKDHLEQIDEKIKGEIKERKKSIKSEEDHVEQKDEKHKERKESLKPEKDHLEKTEEKPEELHEKKDSIELIQDHIEQKDEKIKEEIKQERKESIKSEKDHLELKEEKVKEEIKERRESLKPEKDHLEQKDEKEKSEAKQSPEPAKHHVEQKEENNKERRESLKSEKDHLEHKDEKGEAEAKKPLEPVKDHLEQKEEKLEEEIKERRASFKPEEDHLDHKDEKSTAETKEKKQSVELVKDQVEQKDEIHKIEIKERKESIKGKDHLEQKDGKAEAKEHLELVKDHFEQKEEVKERRESLKPEKDNLDQKDEKTAVEAKEKIEQKDEIHKIEIKERRESLKPEKDNLDQKDEKTAVEAKEKIEQKDEIHKIEIKERRESLKSEKDHLKQKDEKAVVKESVDPLKDHFEQKDVKGAQATDKKDSFEPAKDHVEQKDEKHKVEINAKRGSFDTEKHHLEKTEVEAKEEKESLESAKDQVEQKDEKHKERKESLKPEKDHLDKTDEKIEAETKEEKESLESAKDQVEKKDEKHKEEIKERKESLKPEEDHLDKTDEKIEAEAKEKKESLEPAKDQVEKKDEKHKERKESLKPEKDNLDKTDEKIEAETKEKKESLESAKDQVEQKDDKHKERKESLKPQKDHLEKTDEKIEAETKEKKESLESAKDQVEKKDEKHKERKESLKPEEDHLELKDLKITEELKGRKESLKSEQDHVEQKVDKIETKDPLKLDHSKLKDEKIEKETEITQKPESLKQKKDTEEHKDEEVDVKLKMRKESLKSSEDHPKAEETLKDHKDSLTKPKHDVQLTDERRTSLDLVKEHRDYKEVAKHQEDHEGDKHETKKIEKIEFLTKEQIKTEEIKKELPQFPEKVVVADELTPIVESKAVIQFDIKEKDEIKSEKAKDTKSLIEKKQLDNDLKGEITGKDPKEEIQLGKMDVKEVIEFETQKTIQKEDDKVTSSIIHEEEHEDTIKKSDSKKIETLIHQSIEENEAIGERVVDKFLIRDEMPLENIAVISELSEKITKDEKNEIDNLVQSKDLIKKVEVPEIGEKEEEINVKDIKSLSATEKKSPKPLQDEKYIIEETKLTDLEKQIVTDSNESKVTETVLETKIDVVTSIPRKESKIQGDVQEEILVDKKLMYQTTSDDSHDEKKTVQEEKHDVTPLKLEGEEKGSSSPIKLDEAKDSGKVGDVKKTPDVTPEEKSLEVEEKDEKAVEKPLVIFDSHQMEDQIKQKELPVQSSSTDLKEVQTTTHLSDSHQVITETVDVVEKSELESPPASRKHSKTSETESTSADRLVLIESCKQDQKDMRLLDSQLQQMKSEKVLTDNIDKLGPLTIDTSFDKKELGQKSPKEREEDVIKIVASVAEVLKSDAPLEEFRGKIPIDIELEPVENFMTKLRETHITGPPLSQSPDVVRSIHDEIKQSEEESEGIGKRIFEGVEEIVTGIGDALSTTLHDMTHPSEKGIPEDKETTELSPSKDEDHEFKGDKDAADKQENQKSIVEGLEKFTSEIEYIIESTIAPGKEKAKDHSPEKLNEVDVISKKENLDLHKQVQDHKSEGGKHDDHEKKKSVVEEVEEIAAKIEQDVGSKLHDEKVEGIAFGSEKDKQIKEYDLLEKKSYEKVEISSEISPTKDKQKSDRDDEKIKDEDVEKPEEHERRKSITESFIEGIEKLGHSIESKIFHHSSSHHAEESDKEHLLHDLNSISETKDGKEEKKSEKQEEYKKRKSLTDNFIDGMEHLGHSIESKIFRHSSSHHTVEESDKEHLLHDLNSISETKDGKEEKKSEKQEEHKKRKSLTDNFIEGIENLGHSIESKLFHHDESECVLHHSVSETKSEKSYDQKKEDLKDFESKEDKTESLHQSKDTSPAASESSISPISLKEEEDKEEQLHSQKKSSMTESFIQGMEKFVSDVGHVIETNLFNEKETNSKQKHDDDSKEESQSSATKLQKEVRHDILHSTEKSTGKKESVGETLSKMGSSIFTTIETKLNGFDSSETKHKELNGYTEKTVIEDKITKIEKGGLESCLVESKETLEKAKDSLCQKMESVKSNVEQLVSESKEIINNGSAKITTETISDIQEKVKIDSKQVSEELKTSMETTKKLIEESAQESVSSLSKELDKLGTDIKDSFCQKEIKTVVSTFLANEKNEPKVQHEMTTKTTIAGPSGKMTESIIITSSSRKEEPTWSGKTTPDIADLPTIPEKPETVPTERGDSTPPTVPVSPIVRETIPSVKSTDFRSSTPASEDLEHSDLSSSQYSKVVWESEKQIMSDDDDLPGTPLSTTSQVAASSSSHDLEDESVKLMSKLDPMSMSLYGALPEEEMKSSRVLDEADLDFEKAMKDIREIRGEDFEPSSSPIHMFEVTTAKYSVMSEPGKSNDSRSQDLMTSSFIGELPTDSYDSSEADREKDEILKSWGKPLGLPSPAPLNDNKGTPKKERKIPPNVIAKNKLNEDKKVMDAKKNKKYSPIYLDLTYVPHFGNSNYCALDYFKRVRARYYVFSGLEPSKEVYNALLEAKQTWEDKELEVTIIPTYDTDVLGYWAAENEDLLAKHKIDFSPSASRCTINLQDHETSCSAYRLEFS